MQDGQKLIILGTEYTIQIKSEHDDPVLKECSGYCDETLHLLVVETMDEEEKPNDLVGDYVSYQKRTMRHEILHAFLFECGLGGDVDYSSLGNTHPELMVDWFARLGPKIWKAWQEADAL